MYCITILIIYTRIITFSHLLRIHIEIFSISIDWHWVYIISITGATILLGQWIFIICMCYKMEKKAKTPREKTIHFGINAKKRESLPGNEAEDVHMISITSTEQKPSYETQASAQSSTSSFEEVIPFDFIWHNS